MADPFRGQVLQWRYRDGPTAGKTFEHRFDRRGNVTYGMEGTVADQGTRVRYQAARLAPGVDVVAYVGESGWALTTVVERASGKVLSVATHGQDLIVQRGRLVKPRPRKARSKSPPGRRGVRPKAAHNPGRPLYMLDK